MTGARRPDDGGPDWVFWGLLVLFLTGVAVTVGVTAGRL